MARETLDALVEKFRHGPEANALTREAADDLDRMRLALAVFTNCSSTDFEYLLSRLSMREERGRMWAGIIDRFRPAFATVRHRIEQKTTGDEAS